MFEKKEEELFSKRLIELSNLAYKKGMPCYTDFLNLNELNIYHTVKHKLAPVHVNIWGGFEHAERKIICFCDTNDSPEFPIKIIKIEPVHPKYKDMLSHRDYLGAVLNLGMERSKVGDIIVEEEGNAYLFCNTIMAALILEQLEKIKHTMVTCSLVSDIEFNYEPKFKEITKSVSSIRLDTILSAAYHTSRSSLTSLISGKKVFVNGKLIESNSFFMKEDDVISVRGYGKFIYKGINSQTKKGRYSITILKYI